MDITHHTYFGSNRSRRASPNRGNITILWLFVILSFLLGHAPRLNSRTDSDAEWLKRRVSAQGRSFCVSRQWVKSYGENRICWCYCLQKVKVYPSVRYVPVLYEHVVIVFSLYVSPIILVLPASTIFTKFLRSHTLRGDKYRWGIKISRFSTNKSLYLADDTR